MPLVLQGWATSMPLCNSAIDAARGREHALCGINAAPGSAQLHQCRLCTRLANINAAVTRRHRRHPWAGAAAGALSDINAAAAIAARTAKAINAAFGSTPATSMPLRSCMVLVNPARRVIDAAIAALMPPVYALVRHYRYDH